MVNSKSNTATLPESNKSAADIYNEEYEAQKGYRPDGAPAPEPEPQLSAAAFLEQERAAQDSSAQELREEMTPDYDAQAERATKEELIGGFNFNYEYMGGDTYMKDDLKERQAQRQPGVDKLKRGLNRLAGEFALNVLETPGILFGAGAALVTQDINQMTNNFWVKGAEAMKKKLHGANEVYSSKAVREGGVWDKMSSGEWLATEGASALAFMASALVPGLAINKGAKALGMVRALSKSSRYAKHLRKVDEIASKIPGISKEGLTTLGKTTGDLASNVTVTMANTVFESGIEAMGVQESYKAQLEQKYRDGEINLQEYQENIKYADGAAARTFGLNMALLVGPNMLMTKAMLGPTAHTLTKAHKNIKLSNAGRWVKGGMKEAPKTKVGKFLDKGPVQAVGKMGKGFTKNTFREGVVEEMGQMSIEKYHSDQYMEALLSGEDKRNWAETYAEVLGSTDGQIAALTGGIISAPMSMRTRYLEGKQLRKQTDELVNNYNGTTNYYAAVRQDFFERDEKGNYIVESTDENGVPKFKVDQTKVAELVDAKEEVDRLNRMIQVYMEDGEVDKAAAIAARMQAGAFGTYLHTGPEGLASLREFMMESPATVAGLDAYNAENPTEKVTLQQFVEKEMVKAERMAKDMNYYSTKVSAPLTTSWEKENGVIPGTEEGDAISAERAKFERIYAHSYMESGAVVEELKTRLDKATEELQELKDDDKDSTVIMRQEHRRDKLEEDLKKAEAKRKELQNPIEFEKKWDTHYGKHQKAQKINKGELIYNLDEAIKNVKAATSAKGIRDAVDDAMDRGLILPFVDKDKLPAILDELARTGDIHTALSALAIYKVHHEITEEEAAKIAAKIEQKIAEETISPLDEAEARDQWLQEMAEAELAQSQKDAEEFQDGTNPTEPVEFPGETPGPTGGVLPTKNPEEPHTYKGIPVVVTEDITTAEGTPGAAQMDNGTIKINPAALQEKYEAKAWTKGRPLSEKVDGKTVHSFQTPLPADLFQTKEQFVEFVLEHERQHTLYTRAMFDDKHNFEGTKGQYEDEINQRAIEEIGLKRPVELSTLEILSAIEVNRPEKPQSNSNTFLWLTEATPLDEYYTKLAELVQLVKDKKHTPETIDHIFVALKHNNQLGDAILKIAPNFTKEMAKRGIVGWEQWKEYINEKEVTEADITDAKVEGIDKGYEVPFGVQAELAKIIAEQRKKVKARAIEARIKAFNDTLQKKGRAWADLMLKNKVVKTGSTVHWKGLGGKHMSGIVRSIIKGTEANGTNVLIADTNGDLHVVNAAGLHAQSLNTSAENEKSNKRDQEKKDKEKRTIEKGKEAYAKIGVRSDGHPGVANNGPVDAAHPTIRDKFIKVYNAFLRYLEEPRDKSNDRLEFSLNEKLLKGHLYSDPETGIRKDSSEIKNEEELLLTEIAFNKAKAGEPLSDKEVSALVDWMPMSLRAHRSEGHGSAGAYIRTALSKEDKEFQRIERPIRAAIIKQWIANGGKMDSNNKLAGVSANWGFQYTGDINVDPEMKKDGNRVDNLKGVTIDNMNLFAVGSVESNEVINKNGDRTKVPANLIGKTGGVYITVKDNNGKDSHIRLMNNTLEGRPELDVIMKLIEEIMIGNVRMDGEVPSEIADLIEETMPQFSAMFEEPPTVGELYNLLVYKGPDASQLGTSIDPITRTFSIGMDEWTAEEFLENKDVVKGMLGLKFVNVNFPSADQSKNKLPSTKNLKYLAYIMETKALATNVKEDAAIFVGKEDPNNPNYMGGINPYLSPKEIKSDTKVQRAKRTATRKAGTVAKKAVQLGSRLVKQLRKAGYDPANLSQKSIEFLQGIANKKGKAFVQAIEDYNNRVVAAEDKAGDHVIKKCKG